MAKTIVAFICVHNACRSQMAEALGNALAGDVMTCYSAGSEVQPAINADAVRLVKAHYGIDMAHQYSKRFDAIPTPDLIISMGCEVACPCVGRGFDADWSLPDPTGHEDAFFLDVLHAIETKVLALRDALAKR